MLSFVSWIWFTTIIGVVLSQHKEIVNEIPQPIDLRTRTIFGSSRSLSTKMTFCVADDIIFLFSWSKNICCSHNNWHVTLPIHTVQFTSVQLNVTLGRSPTRKITFGK